MGLEDDLLDIHAEVGEEAGDFVAGGTRGVGEAAHAGPEALADVALVGADVVRDAEGAAALGGAVAGGVYAAEDVVGPLAGDVVEAVEVGGVADAVGEGRGRASGGLHGGSVGAALYARGAANGAECVSRKWAVLGRAMRSREGKGRSGTPLGRNQEGAARLRGRWLRGGGGDGAEKLDTPGKKLDTRVVR